MSKLIHHALKTGTKVANFQVTRILGVGGFGITYKAYDEDLERDVALKEYFPSSLALRDQDGLTITPREPGDADDYEYGLNRFLDEAKTLAKFNQPNIVRVTQFLKQNNTAYLIMNYEEGESLLLQLKKQVTLEERRLMEIVMQVLEGLKVVHAKEFLHRDIKPANIFICSDNRPLLLDFGSARQAIQDREMTAIVTPGYAPPEQYHSKQKQGPWSDLYAVGATMFHCLTGLKPSPALDRLGAIKKSDKDPIEMLLTHANVDCHQSVTDLMLKLMSPEIKDRPQTAAQALEFCNRIMDELNADSIDIDWDPAFLDAVEQVLVEKKVSNAHQLVQRAQEKAHSVQEMANQLADNMDNDEDKTELREATVLLEKTVLLAQPPGEEEHSYVDQTSDLPLYEVLRRTETVLATIMGPKAKDYVAAVANKAATRDDFYKQLLDQLDDDEYRREFIAGIKSFDINCCL